MTQVDLRQLDKTEDAKKIFSRRASYTLHEISFNSCLLKIHFLPPQNSYAVLVQRSLLSIHVSVQDFFVEPSSSTDPLFGTAKRQQSYTKCQNTHITRVVYKLLTLFRLSNGQIGEKSQYLVGSFR